MHPVALTSRINQKCGQCAVRLLFSRNGCELDDDMSFFDDLSEHRRSVIGFRRISFKNLFGRQHDLIGRLSAPAAPSHAIGNHTQ